MIASLLLLFQLSAADLDYAQGMALAREQRWAEAETAFRRGEQKAPEDKRFPLELAGVAFKQRDYGEARRKLRRALRLDPADEYANNFAGTLYLLDGNLEAALKFWNRIGKPRLNEVRAEPEPRLDPVLLDRAFAFSPASTMTLDEYQTTRARLSELDAFSTWNLELQPAGNTDFDAVLRTAQIKPWITALRGLPFETVFPELRNLGGRGVNVDSMLRWDKEKRRASLAVSAPAGRNPAWRYRLFMDARNENWVVPDYAGFNLKRLEAGGEVQSAVSGRWQWVAGGGYSHREFANAPFAAGNALEAHGGVRTWLVRIPERRFSVDAGGDWRLGRFFGQGEFTQLQGSAEARWFPQARGDDYETSLRFRAARSTGPVPFDELFLLGLERDTDLWLRGHIGTADGRKGSSPVGADYVLENWELNKTVRQGSFYTLRIGPFLDTGHIWGPPGRRFGYAGWMVDPGIQAKVRLLGGAAEVVFSWGKDLRTGGNAWYVLVR